MTHKGFCVHNVSLLDINGAWKEFPRTQAAMMAAGILHHGSDGRGGVVGREDVRLMRVISVVSEVLNEEMLLMGRVRSDVVITAEDLMLQKTNHEMDFADLLKFVQLVMHHQPRVMMCAGSGATC